MSPADSPFAQLPAPGPHPATAELRAYAAGTLAPADEHRIEAHTLDCERCADLVEGFSMSDAATTNHAVAELRTRLQARVGTAETLKPVASPWAWPRLATAAALLGVVGSGIWAWEQHDTVPKTATAQLETAPAAPAESAVQPPPALPPSPSEAEVAAAPKAAKDTFTATAKPADYAAVTPAGPARRASGRPSMPIGRATDDQADRVVLADLEASANNSPIAEASPAAEEDKRTASAPAPDSPAEVGYGAPAKPTKKMASGLVGRTSAADTTTSARNGTITGQLDKAKSMAASAPAASSAAPVLVPATPMPAAPTINPAPVTGTIAFREYLRREAAGFDPEINNLRLSGTVRIRFIVEADGKLSKLKVTRGLRKDYDDEALRLVCEGPAWQPGIAGGKRAPLPMEVTVPF